MYCLPTSIWLIVHMVTRLISHSNPKSEREVKKLTPYHSASMHRAVTHTRPTGSRTHTCCHSSSVAYFYFVMSNSHALAEKWVKSCLCVWVAESYLTLCNPMDCSSRGSSVSGILQERILEGIAIPFSRGSSQPRDWTQVSHIAGRFFTIWTTREAQNLLRRVCIWSFLCDPVPLSARKRQLPTAGLVLSSREAGRWTHSGGHSQRQLFPILPAIGLTQQDVLRLNGRTNTISSVQFSSVAQSYSTLCDPMDCSTPGLPVHHQLLEFTQTRVHWVGDAIQPSHPVSSPSPPAFSLYQHQGFFQESQFFASGGPSLDQFQHQSFQWIFRTNFL